MPHGSGTMLDPMTAQQQILVVDDDPDIRGLISDYLTGVGYEVVTAADAGAMRACVQARVPNVVLLDVGLPGEDGLSLARYLREHHDIGIIMVSGAAFPNANGRPGQFCNNSNGQATKGVR